MSTAVRTWGGAVRSLNTIFHAITRPPTFTDEQKTYTCKLLYLMLWTYMATAPLTMLIAVALPKTFIRWLVFNIVTCTVAPCILWLVRRGRTELAGWLTVAHPWGVALFADGVDEFLYQGRIELSPRTSFQLCQGLIL